MKNTLNAAVIIIAALYCSAIYSQVDNSTRGEASSIGLKYHDKVTASTNGQSNFETRDLFSQIMYDFGNLKKTRVSGKLIDLKSKGDSIQPSNNLEQSNSKSKSIWLGMAFSAVIPGAGEFYAKNYLKAAIFFGIEAASWITYYYFQHTGDKKTTDFQNFANQNWSVRRYGQWLKDQGFDGSSGINPNEQNLETLRSEINVCESQNFSHTLPEYGTQQFYELIGKYQNFEAGWIGEDLILTKNNYETRRDPIFVNYSYSRQDANNFYNRGTTMSMVIIANHILSIGDAAWTVAMFNKNLKVQTGFRIDTYYTPYTMEEKTMPTFNMRVNF